ncbi:hypothetical protein HANVADRAFT_51028 [Hanseniaspora valbyensis NRRL Y-1626]|uniref:Uncharacterized protein n=1 Tax=Hanseniaspora valbyensis NRRL Y-1626 TaxID=766949 RepID=A0A1B7TKC5_9ASCO|nr:hypothetical protein HANVADRAFT_51028 [Hanseniaspora valbyensis NRRL Y-1626]
MSSFTNINESIRRNSSTLSSIVYNHNQSSFNMGNHVVVNEKISTYISSLSSDASENPSNGKVIVILKDSSLTADRGCLYQEYKSLEEIYIQQGYTVIIPNISLNNVSASDIKQFLKYIRVQFPNDFISLLSADNCCNILLESINGYDVLVNCLYFINPIKLKLDALSQVNNDIPVMIHFNNDKVPMSIRYVIESKLKELNFKYQIIVDNLYNFEGNENIAFERVCLEQLYWFEKWANC